MRDSTSHSGAAPFVSSRASNSCRSGVRAGLSKTVGESIPEAYTGRLATGSQFDTNVDATSPLTFTIGLQQVIPGFEAGIVGMQLGGKRQIIIPPALAYGTAGQGPIPANAILVFDVELVSIR